jgi:aminopeptidase
MPGKKFQESLKKYADAIVKVGLNLRAGQRLIVTLAANRGVPLEFAPLVREITRSAYTAGARYVEVLWGDGELLKLQAALAPEESLGEYPAWKIRAILEMIENGDALLSITGMDPDLLGSLDPQRVGKMQQTHLERFGPVSEKVTTNAVNWCVVAAAGSAWACKVFSSLTPERAVSKLWKAIFETARVDSPDPLAAWREHILNLKARAQYMQARRYKSLQYNAPGTDFNLGLPEGHQWISAQSLARNGIAFTANMPTEEVFTLPHRERAEGLVTSTFPLSYGGTLIEEFTVKFENGRITRVTAKRGEAALQKLVDTDEGSQRLGEVSLVPASSPIARRGHLFYNTLFDENASCHIAIGRGYRFTLAGGDELTDDEFRQRGGNVSLNHVDFMIGSPQMDIDGITREGAREPVMRKGEWAFDA